MTVIEAMLFAFQVGLVVSCLLIPLVLSFFAIGWAHGKLFNQDAQRGRSDG